MHSLLPPNIPGAAAADGSQTGGDPNAAADSSRAASAARYDFSEIRRHFRNGRHSNRVPVLDPSAAAGGISAQDGNPREMDRPIQLGEDMRVAIVIRMPRDPAEVEREEEARSFLDEYEEDERPGWQPGMELGVWEGRVGPGR